MSSARLDRYNHEVEEDSEGGECESVGSSGPFSFASFSSASPRYHRSGSTAGLAHQRGSSSSSIGGPTNPEDGTRGGGDLGDLSAEGGSEGEGPGARGRSSVSREDSGHSDHSESSSRSTLDSSTNTPDRENPNNYHQKATTTAVLAEKEKRNSGGEEAMKDSKGDSGTEGLSRSSEEKEFVPYSKSGSRQPSADILDSTRSKQRDASNCANATEKISDDVDKKRSRKTGISAGKDSSTTRISGLSTSHRSSPNLSSL